MKTEEINYGFLKEYFPEMPEGPFLDEEEEKEAYFRFIDMLSILSIFQNEEVPEESADRIGSILSGEDLVFALEPHERAVFPEWEYIRSIFLALARRSNDSPWLPISAFLNSGQLSALEALALIMAYASAENRKYGRVFAILMGERNEVACPSAGLVSDMGRFFLTEEEDDIGNLSDSDSFMNTVVLMDTNKEKGNYYGPERPIILRSSVLQYLRQQDGGLGELAICCEYLDIPQYDYICHKEELEELKYVYAAMLNHPDTGVIELSGAAGSGKRFILSLAAAENVQRILSVDLRKLFSLSPDMQIRLCNEMLIRSAIEDACTYLYGVEEIPDLRAAIIRTVAALQKSLSLIIIGTERPLSERITASFRGELYRISLGEADSHAQKELWQEALNTYNAKFEKDIDPEELVSKYTMNPGRIFEAVANTSALSGTDKKGVARIDKLTLQEQIRRICAVQFGENAVRLKSSFTWDDLVVEPESRKLLQMACDRIIYKSRVNEDYGFGKKLPYGRGVSIVLYGPPGTGKTMAAQVLSNELGLDMYRIDLSQISSKYIGETEKNLGNVFDAAKNSNAILFFDEADSLFSKRTEITSSNDKYANAETSYLLQKIEEYSGVSILATNNMQNFDAAFKRRMTYMIPIGIPDEATRLSLWEKAFPEGAPLDKSVDFSILARAVEISGSNIKSSAIAAAYRAAARDGRITMDDIAEAVDMECRKNGKMGAKNDILQASMAGNITEEEY